jgi:tetratricopeptide (TPR) repeat protein
VNNKARNIKAIVLRKLGRFKQAKQEVVDVIAADPLDFFAMNELYLSESGLRSKTRTKKALANLTKKMRNEVETYLELAVDYGNCGLWDEAIEVLLRPVKSKVSFAGTYPIVYYYLGCFYQQKGNATDASNYFSRAAKMPTEYCFPFRLESIEVLNAAIKHNPSDARAHYYLGNLLYDLQPQEAIKLWKKSRVIDDSFAAVHRNLGWAYYRTENNIPKAISCYEKAVSCNNKEPRLYVELDHLYEDENIPLLKRLALLEKNHQTVVKRNDSFLREIMVMVLVGRYDEAIDFLAKNHFHVREGGGGIHDVYVDGHLLRGMSYLKNKEFKKALSDFQKASEYPENLSVGRPESDRRAPQVAYYIGTAYEALGDNEKAAQFYRQAADQKVSSRRSEARFYQGLCSSKLGRKEKAEEIFDELIEAAKKKLSQEAAVDVFAKFGQQQTEKARKASAHYALGLGYFGKDLRDEAKAEFEKAVKLNVSHVWAKAQLAELR